MTKAQMREALEKLGNPVGAEFSQSNATSLAPLKKVEQGMCKGLTLDWIRRVLTGGKGASTGNPFVLDDSDAAKGIASTNAAKNLKQYKKGAYIQLTTNKSTMDPFFNDLKKRQHDLLKDKLDKVNQYIAQLETTAVDQADYDAKVHAIRAAYDKWERETHTPSTTTDNRLKIFWEQYCRNSPVGKHQSHRLSNLTVVAASSHKQYVGGLIEFLSIAIKAVGENQAATVGVAPPMVEQSGHAIGIHRLNTSRYHLFEPNFGVYDMTSQANLFKALLFLFAKGYPANASIGNDGHAYEVGGVVAGEYVVFARR